MKSKGKDQKEQEVQSDNSSEQEIQILQEDQEGRYQQVKCLLCGQVFQKDSSAKHTLKFHWESMNVENGKIRTLEGIDFERLDPHQKVEDARKLNLRIIAQKSLQKIPADLTKKAAIELREKAISSTVDQPKISAVKALTVESCKGSTVKASTVQRSKTSTVKNVEAALALRSSTVKNIEAAPALRSSTRIPKQNLAPLRLQDKIIKNGSSSETESEQESEGQAIEEEAPLPKKAEKRTYGKTLSSKSSKAANTNAQKMLSPSRRDSLFYKREGIREESIKWMEEEIKIRKKEKKSLKTKEAWDKKRKSASLKGQSKEKEPATVQIADKTTVQQKKITSQSIELMESQEQNLNMLVLSSSPSIMQEGRELIDIAQDQTLNRQELAALQQVRMEVKAEKVSTVEGLVKGISQQLKEVLSTAMDFNRIEELANGQDTLTEQIRSLSLQQKKRNKKIQRSISELTQELQKNNQFRERDLKMQEKILRKQIRMEVIQEQLIKKVSRLNLGYQREAHWPRPGMPWMGLYSGTNMSGYGRGNMTQDSVPELDPTSIQDTTSQMNASYSQQPMEMVQTQLKHQEQTEIDSSLMNLSVSTQKIHIVNENKVHTQEKEFITVDKSSSFEKEGQAPLNINLSSGQSLHQASQSVNRISAESKLIGCDTQRQEENEIGLRPKTLAQTQMVSNEVKPFIKADNEEEKHGAIEPNYFLKMNKDNSEKGVQSRQIMGPFEMPDSRTQVLGQDRRSFKAQDQTVMPIEDLFHKADQILKTQLILKQQFVDTQGLFNEGLYEGGLQLRGFKYSTPRGVVVSATDLLYGQAVTLKISLSVELSQGYEEELRNSFTCDALQQEIIVKVHSLIRNDSRCLLVLENLDEFTPLNEMMVNDLTDAKRLSITKALLKNFSYLNSLGVFHNNLNLFNVMLSKRSEVKVQELDSMSRQGSIFQTSSAMKKNPFYGSTVYKRCGLIEDAHSGYDAYALAHLIFLIQKGEGSIKYRAYLKQGMKAEEKEKLDCFLACETQLKESILYGLELRQGVQNHTQTMYELFLRSFAKSRGLKLQNTTQQVSEKQ